MLQGGITQHRAGSVTNGVWFDAWRDNKELISLIYGVYESVKKINGLCRVVSDGFVSGFNYH